MFGFASSIRNNKAKGFGLVEVLISLLILSTIMLGTTIVFINISKQNHSNYMRSKASILATDVIARIKSNPAQLNSYLSLDVSTDPGASPDCSVDVGCVSNSIFQRDIVHIYQALKDFSGTLEINQVGTLDLYRITISWQQRNSLVAGNTVSYTSSYELDFSPD